jgi:hypothetical protein
MKLVRARVCLLAFAFPVTGFAGPAPDADNDTLPDVLDNCSAMPNAGVLPCDTETDGYGNLCGGDFDQPNTVNATNFSTFFLPQFNPPASVPGPSGLPCAGSAGCQ